MPAKVVSGNACACILVVAIVAIVGNVGKFHSGVVLVLVVLLVVVVVAVTLSLAVLVVVAMALVSVVVLEPPWVLMEGVAVVCGRADNPDFMASFLDAFREAALQHSLKTPSTVGQQSPRRPRQCGEAPQARSRKPGLMRPIATSTCLVRLLSKFLAAGCPVFGIEA